MVFPPNNDYGYLIFLLMLLLIGIINALKIRRLNYHALDEINQLNSHSKLNQLDLMPLSDWPLVSVLVPARNEELNITSCIESLIKQDYPNFEVICHYDPESIDRTENIVIKLKAKYPSLKIIRALPLPEDWTGKNWACHNLFLHAKGEFLLFTDADTVHSSDCLRKSMSSLLFNKCDYLSLSPKEIMSSFLQKLIVPFVWIMLTIVPVGLSIRRAKKSLCFVIGQFMLIKRSIYEKSGGYLAIQSNALDDLHLGKNIAKVGGKLLFARGGDCVQCKMYTRWIDAFNGISRSLFPAFGYHSIIFLFCWTWILFCFLIPFMKVLFLLISGFSNPSNLIFPIASVILCIAILSLNYSRYHIPIWVVLFYPISFVLGWISALKSFFNVLGNNLKWKGRKLPKQKVHLI